MLFHDEQDSALASEIPAEPIPGFWDQNSTGTGRQRAKRAASRQPAPRSRAAPRSGQSLFSNMDAPGPSEIEDLPGQRFLF